MTDILINLDVVPHAHKSKLSLLEMVRDIDGHWYDEVSCITQEIDGELLYWNAKIEDVILARHKANLEQGLMPLIGFANQVHGNYFEPLDGQAYVAKDWQSAVVTKDIFLNCFAAVAE